MVSLASEFPNDNPDLHRGVIWVCREPTGRALPERAPSEALALGDELAYVRGVPLAGDPDLGEDVEASAPSRGSLAPPEDEQEDEAAAPIVVEELEPVEARVEGAPTAERAPPIEEGAPAEGSLALEGDPTDACAESDPYIATELVAPVATAPAATPIAAPAPAESGVARAGTSEDEAASVAESGVALAGTSEEEAAPVAASVAESGVVLAGASEEEAVPVAASVAESGVVLAGASEEEAAPVAAPVAESGVVLAGASEEEAAPVAAPVAESGVVLAGASGEHADYADAGFAPVFDEVLSDDNGHRDSTALPPPPDDPFTVLVFRLADVAISAGSPNVASLLPGLLFDGRLPDVIDPEVADALRAAGLWDGSEVAPSFVAVTCAWRAILRGTSDDFDACGASTLDEWASDLLARLLSAPARMASLRQELRSRGVAAFGLVEAA